MTQENWQYIGLTTLIAGIGFWVYLLGCEMDKQQEIGR